MLNLWSRVQAAHQRQNTIPTFRRKLQSSRKVSRSIWYKQKGKNQKERLTEVLRIFLK